MIEEDVECLNKTRTNRERALDFIKLDKTIRSACRSQINVPYFKTDITRP